ncbi:MAG: NADH-quinone oxidoreductase subunit C [Thermodesulfobacteriota bacterium]
MSSSVGLISAIEEKFNDKLTIKSEYRGEITFSADKKDILQICKTLKLEFKFLFLVDLTVVDYLKVKFPRYEVVYLLHRFGDDYEENVRIRIKVPLEDKNPIIASVTSVWSGADWLEREAYDMFGVEFKGHPDLRRILMPEDYDEFPLRKDFDVRNRESSKRSFEKALEEGKEL